MDYCGRTHAATHQDMQKHSTQQSAHDWNHSSTPQKSLPSQKVPSDDVVLFVDSQQPTWFYNVLRDELGLHAKPITTDQFKSHK